MGGTAEASVASGASGETPKSKVKKDPRAWLNERPPFADQRGYVYWARTSDFYDTFDFRITTSVIDWGVPPPKYKAAGGARSKSPGKTKGAREPWRNARGVADKEETPRPGIDSCKEPPTVVNFWATFVPASGALPELVFACKLKEDDGRKFILRLGGPGGKVKVWEEATDGFPRGWWYKGPCGVPPSRFAVGAEVIINQRAFELLAATDGTLALMEKYAACFPMSDAKAICGRLARVAEALRGAFAAQAGSDAGIDAGGAGRVLGDVGGLVVGEVLTILRRFPQGPGRFAWKEFLDALPH